MTSTDVSLTGHKLVFWQSDPDKISDAAYMIFALSTGTTDKINAMVKFCEENNLEFIGINIKWQKCNWMIRDPCEDNSIIRTIPSFLKVSRNGVITIISKSDDCTVSVPLKTLLREMLNEKKPVVILGRQGVEGRDFVNTVHNDFPVECAGLGQDPRYLALLASHAEIYMSGDSWCCDLYQNELEFGEISAEEFLAKAWDEVGVDRYLVGPSFDEVVGDGDPKDDKYLDEMDRLVRIEWAKLSFKKQLKLLRKDVGKYWKKQPSLL